MAVVRAPPPIPPLDTIGEIAFAVFFPCARLSLLLLAPPGVCALAPLLNPLTAGAPLFAAGEVATSLGRITCCSPVPQFVHGCIKSLALGVAAAVAPPPRTKAGTSVLQDDETVEDWMICWSLPPLAGLAWSGLCAEVVSRSDGGGRPTVTDGMLGRGAATPLPGCGKLVLLLFAASSTEPGLYGEPGSEESLEVVLESVQLSTATPLKAEEGIRVS